MITSLHTACDTVALSKGERKGQLYLRPALRPKWPPALLKSLLNSLRRLYACINAIGPETTPDVPSSGSFYELEKDKVQDTLSSGAEATWPYGCDRRRLPTQFTLLRHVNAHAQLLTCLPACQARRGGAGAHEPGIETVM